LDADLNRWSAMLRCPRGMRAAILLASAAISYATRQASSFSWAKGAGATPSGACACACACASAVAGGSWVVARRGSCPARGLGKRPACRLVASCLHIGLAPLQLRNFDILVGLPASHATRAASVALCTPGMKKGLVNRFVFRISPVAKPTPTRPLGNKSCDGLSWHC
jgi:hypothetical protein